jgi:hypothetical protein
MRTATQSTKQAKGKEPEEGRPLTEVTSIFPVERSRVAAGFVWRRVPLRTFGRAPFASPVHRLGFARKAKAVTEEPAFEHRLQRTPSEDPS